MCSDTDDIIFWIHDTGSSSTGMILGIIRFQWMRPCPSKVCTVRVWSCLIIHYFIIISLFIWVDFCLIIQKHGNGACNKWVMQSIMIVAASFSVSTVNYSPCCSITIVRPYFGWKMMNNIHDALLRRQQFTMWHPSNVPLGIVLLRSQAAPMTQSCPVSQSNQINHYKSRCVM